MGEPTRSHGGANSARTVRRRRVLQTAGAAALTGLAGCVGGLVGGGDDDGVEFWTLFEGGDGDAMDAMVENVNAEHELELSPQRVPWDQYYDRLSTTLTGDDVPDVAVMHADRMLEYQELLRPLGDEIGTGPYLDSVADHGVIDGEQLAVPLDTHPYGLYYNKDLFEEAGLDPESPPNSPEAFEEAANAIVDNTDDWAANYTAGFFMLAVYNMFLESRGGELLTDDLSPAFDGEDGVAVAEFLHDATHEHGWIPEDPDAGWDAWQRGEVGMQFNGTWHIGVLEEVDFEWGMAKPFVMPGSGNPKTWANSHMLVIPRSDSRSEEREEDAIEAIRLLTQEYNAQWGADAGHLPASQEASDSDELRESDVWDRTLNTFYEMADDDQLAYLPITEQNGAYQEQIFQQLDDMRLGNVDPDEAIENAAEGVRQVFN